MSRPNLKRSNSVIFSAKTDSFVLNIRPITNSRSTTQIDSLKDGIKIDNVQPIKKWSYLDNSNKSSSCLPDRAIDINMNESASNKMFCQTHKPISSSPEEENTRPFVFECAVTKQNSIDSLINKLDKGANNKTDYPIPNARPIKNSQSMTQIDSLKDGIKIDNVQPIKKWSYLDNSNNSSSRSPDSAININMNEPASNKMHFRVHKSISSSLVEENARPLFFKNAVTKQNSIDSLIKKLEKGANAKTDYLMPNARPITNSQSMTQIDSLKDRFKTDKIQPGENRTYFDNFNKTSPSCLSASATNININESLSVKENFHQYKPKSASKVHENTRPFVGNSLAAEENSTDYLITKIKEDAEAEVKFQTVTNGITRQKNIDANKEKENALEASFVDDREDNIKNLSLKSSGSVQSIPENSEGNKVKECGSDENIFEDEQFFDMWNSYVERPLLPLKPLQKHRSLSCTNLVQAIKGFSRKKSGANNRFSSPENTLFESRELCTSEANISNMPPRKVSIESADQNFVRLPKSQDNSSESVTIKSERKSLQHYPWYHLVDAKEASKRLVRMGRNGAFLIRPASNPTNDVLNTLCVMCFGRVYNFHIRNLKDGRITLGRKCKGEQIETFSSLLDMIKYHQTVPITINLAGQVGLVHLLITPPK